jgi:predicted nucleic acid-binding protein
MKLNNEYLIIDSGFFVALGNERDQHHKKAVKVLKNLPKRKWITTWPVLTEVCHLLLRVSQDKLSPFLRNLESGAFSVFPLTEKDYSTIHELIIQYQDLPMDLADASLVILANHLQQGDILSTDYRDFKTYKWKNHAPFNNLFETFR